MRALSYLGNALSTQVTTHLPLFRHHVRSLVSLPSVFRDLVSWLRSTRSATRTRRAGLAAIAVLAVAYALPTPESGSNQTAHYALVRALADGTARIDRTRFEVGDGGTADLSKIDGHYYAAKSPGLAFESFVPYVVLKAAGGAKPVHEPHTQLWYLTLWGALLPAVVLLLLVRHVVDRLEPGFGAAAAVTLGIATMALPFATLYFSHSLSAMLLFAAFAVLWREREGEARLDLLVYAGILAGLAATVEIPVALIGAILGLYALARGDVLRRAAAYAGGAFIGGLPTLVYNRWAFGHPFEFPYANVVSAPGGATVNKVGLYGVTAPKFHVLVELLFARIGLLTLMPVLVLGAVGLVFLYRSGRRAEALVAAAVSLVYLLLIAGYETPFGGYTPGPRFLVAILPFLILGLGSAYKRLPLTTIALAAGSAVEMVAITITNPLSATAGGWFHRFAHRHFEGTAFNLAGIAHVGVPLFLLLVCAVAGLTVFASSAPELTRRDGGTAILALLGWIFLAARTPHLVETQRTWAALGLVAAIVAVVVVVPRAVASSGISKRRAALRRPGSS